MNGFANTPWCTCTGVDERWHTEPLITIGDFCLRRDVPPSWGSNDEPVGHSELVFVQERLTTSRTTSTLRTWQVFGNFQATLAARCHLSHPVR